MRGATGDYIMSRFLLLLVVSAAAGCGPRFNNAQSSATSSGVTTNAPVGVLSLLAGSIGSAGSMDGTGSSARFFRSYGSAVDSSGNVCVA